jgi:hypothetical protein
VQASKQTNKQTNKQINKQTTTDHFHLPWRSPGGPTRRPSPRPRPACRSRPVGGEFRRLIDRLSDGGTVQSRVNTGQSLFWDSRQRMDGCTYHADGTATPHAGGSRHEGRGQAQGRQEAEGSLHGLKKEGVWGLCFVGMGVDGEGSVPINRSFCLSAAPAEVDAGHVSIVHRDDKEGAPDRSIHRSAKVTVWPLPLLSPLLMDGRRRDLEAHMRVPRRPFLQCSIGSRGRETLGYTHTHTHTHTHMSLKIQLQSASSSRSGSDWKPGLARPLPIIKRG